MLNHDQKRLSDALLLLPERAAGPSIWAFLEEKLNENALFEVLKNLPERDGPDFSTLFSDQILAENGLKKALENLPERDGPTFSTLFSNEILDENHLKKILTNLPERDGPTFIELFSNENLNENGLKKALENLPEYAAPASVWQNLETGFLEKTASKKTEQGRIVALPSLIFRFAAAAAVVGFAAFLFLKNDDSKAKKVAIETPKTPLIFEKTDDLKPTENAESAVVWTQKDSKPRISETQTNFKTTEETVTLTFREEQIDSYLEAEIAESNAVLEAEKEAIALVEHFCEEQIAACETTDFKSLKNQLEDLTAACEKLQTALETFGTDADLQCQLGLLERERSSILKKLVELAIG